ncbi:MAG: Crp/Fnr family transcriptional regulator [Elusimicrobia bacterium]|nr:Crp/Fnr family transcriptional regulator [Elusimicrobiota bacterium]
MTLSIELEYQMNLQKNKYALLRKVSLLKGISSKTLNKIAQFAQFNSFKKGEEIFSKDSSGECLYVLVNGRVKIYTSIGAHSKTFALLDPGDFFGEMALLGEPIRSASAKAILSSELLILDRKDFQKFLQEDNFLSLKVLRTLCSRLRQADREIEKLSFQNVVGRTILTLFDLEARYGKPCSNGILINAQISQTELADLIGTAREMVSRVLSGFKRMNWISMEAASGKIMILNKDKLKSCIYE